MWHNSSQTLRERPADSDTRLRTRQQYLGTRHVGTAVAIKDEAPIHCARCLHDSRI